MGKLLALTLYIFMNFSVFWYKIRYINLKPIKNEPKELNLTAIKEELKNLLSRFKYTFDGVGELGDAIVPPDHAYKQLTSKVLNDDCDGFHAGVYEMLNLSGYKTVMVTALNENVMTNHVMVLFKNNDILYLVNYDRVIKLFSMDGLSKRDFIKKLMSEFTNQCGSKSYLMFGLIFTKNRWFKRVNLYKFFGGK